MSVNGSNSSLPAALLGARGAQNTRRAWFPTSHHRHPPRPPKVAWSQHLLLPPVLPGRGHQPHPPMRSQCLEGAWLCATCSPPSQACPPLCPGLHLLLLDKCPSYSEPLPGLWAPGQLRRWSSPPPSKPQPPVRHPQDTPHLPRLHLSPCSSPKAPTGFYGTDRCLHIRLTLLVTHGAECDMGGDERRVIHRAFLPVPGTRAAIPQKAQK